MSTPQPLLFRGKTQDLLTRIENELRDPDGLGWQGQPGGAGKATVSLFGRFADIIVTRLNKVPQQHFLAFLSEGGVDQLPPRGCLAACLRARKRRPTGHPGSRGDAGGDPGILGSARDHF